MPIFDESLFHFPVRESQSVAVELLVIILDGQVTALVEQWQRVLVHDVDAVGKAACI